MKKSLIITLLASVSLGLSSCKKDPNAQFTASSTTVAVGEAVSFTDGSSDAYGYVWDFGDGDQLTETQNPSHIYDTPGTYSVVLQVTDKKGKNTVVSSPVAITVSDTVAPAPSPTVSFTTNADSMAYPGQLITFTNTSVNGYNYAWDFGDGGSDNSDRSGNSSNVYNTSYRYSEEGEYTVTLQAEDVNGNVYTATKVITVTLDAASQLENEYQKSEQSMVTQVSGKWKIVSEAYTFSTQISNEGFRDTVFIGKDYWRFIENTDGFENHDVIITDSNDIYKSQTSWDFLYENAINAMNPVNNKSLNWPWYNTYNNGWRNWIVSVNGTTMTFTYKWTDSAWDNNNSEYIDIACSQVITLQR